MDRVDKSFENDLFELYIEMRKKLLDADNFRYEITDFSINSNEFKMGFVAGVRVMMSLDFDKNF